jgi:hypothetical protein
VADTDLTHATDLDTHNHEFRRVSCGAGRQPPFRVPHCLHRIRRESGVSMSSHVTLCKVGGGTVRIGTLVVGGKTA